MKGKNITNGVGSVFKTVGLVLVTILLIGLTTAAICGMAFAVYINKYITPDLDINLKSHQLNQTSFIYSVDANGEKVLLEQLYGTENRVWAGIKDIPKQLQLAFVSVEDSRFYSHNGVDWKRTIGAAANFIVPFRDNFGGGSTITQQLIKNLTGEDETSVERKIQEIMRALEVEKQYEKDEILELYLNTIYFGQGAYGVRQAAKVYFDKELNQLTLAECAAIAGITKNPYKFDLKRYPENNEERRSVVLWTMLEAGNITREEYDRAMAENVQAVRSVASEDAEDVYQSYYVDAVMDQIISDLVDKYNYSKPVATQLLYSGGLEIVVPIDLEIQAIMDEVFQDVDNFPGGLGNDGTYPQAAMTLMDPYTGHVVAMYGGRGVKYGNRVINRATSARRQPGSAIKPLTVYTPAIENGGLTPITVIDDAPSNFTNRAGGWPLNENRRWSGLCTVYRGIANSYNTVAVDVLENYVGAAQSYYYATSKFGLDLVDVKEMTRKDGSTYTLTDIAAAPLALGGLTSGLSTQQMTAAYASFVNNGIYIEPILYTIVYDAEGNVLLDNTDPMQIEAMSPKTRDYMIDLLTHVVTSGTGTKARLDGVQVGGKTGTTSDDNDRWFAGITPYYAGVVWFGYDTPQSLQKFSTNPSLELWHRVMTKVHENLESRSFSKMQDGYVTVEYCLDSGLVPTQWCVRDVRGGRVATATIHSSDKPTKMCDVHVEVKIDGTTERVANEYCPEISIRSAGAIYVPRAYPSSSVNITDAAYGAPYTLTLNQQAEGLHKPANVGLAVCTVHGEHNDGNAPTEPETEETDPLESDPNELPGGGEPIETDPSEGNIGYPGQDGDEEPNLPVDGDGE